MMKLVKMSSVKFARVKTAMEEPFQKTDSPVYNAQVKITQMTAIMELQLQTLAYHMIDSIGVTLL